MFIAVFYNFTQLVCSLSSKCRFLKIISRDFSFNSTYLFLTPKPLKARGLCVASALADPCRNAGRELEFIFHVPRLILAPTFPMSTCGFGVCWLSFVPPPPTPQLGIDDGMFMVQNTWLQVPSR